MPFLFLLFYIFIEIALFIWIGGAIGVGWTLLWILAGFLIGGWMLKRGGNESRKWLQQASQGGEVGKASKQIYWFIGGLLVILPGFFTDALGLLLVFPPTQSLITWIISLFIPESVQTGFTIISNMRNEGATAEVEVIDGEAYEITDRDA